MVVQMVMLSANARCSIASVETAGLIFVAIVAIVLNGCGAEAKTSPALSPTAQAPTETAETKPSPKAMDRAVPVGESEESWRVTRMNGSKTGFSRVTVQPAKLTDETDEEKAKAVIVTVHDETRVRRFDQITEQKYTVKSLMRENGELIAFEARLKAGPSDSVTRGEVRNGRLRIVSELGAETQTESIEWSPEWGGVGADEVSLRRAPLKPGETRTVDFLTPVLHRRMTIQWKATEWKEIRLPDGEKRRLLEVELDWTSTKPPLSLKGSHWIDEEGRIQMSQLPSLSQVTYRTDRRRAVQAEAEVADLGVSTIVKVDKPIPNAKRTKRVVYEAHLPHGDPLTSFVSGATQRVRSLGEHRVEVEVLAISPMDPLEASSLPEDAPPSAADLSPNTLIQVDDPGVKRLAAEVRGDDPWKVARELERLVSERIDLKNFTHAFASAADVARGLEGDCTEHAVLLAALCRAKKIPARVAIGLVYFERESGFAFHMWNEVWIKDRWVPLDATLGLGQVGAERLKVASSNLDGASPYWAFLPVLPLMQQLEVRVKSVE